MQSRNIYGFKIEIRAVKVTTFLSGAEVVLGKNDVTKLIILTNKTE